MVVHKLSKVKDKESTAGRFLSVSLFPQYFINAILGHDFAMACMFFPNKKINIS
jgi:hypothetical protein